MPLNGFEVRGAHRDSTAPTTNDCSNKVYGLQLAAGALLVSGVYKLIGLKLVFSALFFLILSPTLSLVKRDSIILACQANYPKISSTSSISISETSGIPLTSAASGVSAAMSLRVRCSIANLRLPAMSWRKPWESRS